jgi:hypothetical protein
MTVMTRPSPRPRPDQLPAVPASADVDLYTSGGDPLAALEAAAAVYRVARDKGLPDPQLPTVVGDRIEVSLPFPHLLLWIDMLDGFGPADLPDGYTGEAGEYRYEWGGYRTTVLPNHRVGDYSVVGWTYVDDDGGRRRKRRKQQWVLRLLNEQPCRHCAGLPEPARQPLSVEGWFEQRWFELTGHCWDEPAQEPVTGPIPTVPAVTP